MIRTEERGRVAILWLDRHEQRNALDTEHCELLRNALGDVQAAGARAVVITGEGSSFCAGADFGEVYGEGYRKALYEMLRRFTTSPVPIIAAVNGPAIGAGTQLALAFLAGGGPARRILLACEPLSADDALACGLADTAGDLDAALERAARIA